MKLRIQYVLPLFLLFACDKVERDWSKCNLPDTPCAKGFACVNYLCVPADAGGGDAVVAPVEAGGREVATHDAVDAALDAPVDAPGDAPQFDSEPDATVDTRPVDGLGSCGIDQNCPASAPMCLNFRCAKCTGNNDCSGRSDGGAGAAVCEPTSGKCVVCVKSSDCTADPTKPVCGANNQCAACTANSQCAGRSDGGVGAGVCEPASGKCVACVKSSECTSDPAKPVCVANQCAACSSAASECEIKNGAAPVCQTTSGKCVGCVATSDCVGDADGGVDGGGDGGVVAGFCNTTTNQCVGCLSSRDCSDPSKPICGTAQTCVACGSSVDGCTTKNSTMPVCKAAAGTCVECGGDSDCKTSTIPACDTANKCVECVQSSHCKNASAPVCDTSAEHCVQCLKDSDCSGTTPICTNKQCAKCTSDAQCVAKLGANPGVCGLDGSCPGDDAVIYLQNSASCSTSSGSGTAASPYCFSDDAVGALLATKSVIVVRGSLAVNPKGSSLTLSFSGAPVLIAGKTSAKLGNPPSGTPPLVNITAGEVTLRDLTISGGNDAGVSVSGGAILHMDRCYVTGNTKNGIITDKSAFDIVNTVIANNGAGAYQGVILGSYTGSGPTKFAFNTVVNNGAIGVACGQSYTLTGILANGNGGLNFSSTCVTNATTSTSTTPNFVSPTNYHLTATSPCVNAGGATCPPDDIDGDTRPIGTACDCGADEYKPN